MAPPALTPGWAVAEVLRTRPDYRETAAVQRTSVHDPPSRPSGFSVAAEAELDLYLIPRVTANEHYWCLRTSQRRRGVEVP